MIEHEQPRVEASQIGEHEQEHWSARYGKSIIFVILTLITGGIYLAFTIPISVFPSTNFPRIVIGIDNGVAPIDQMLVTVTRPIGGGSQRAGAGPSDIGDQPGIRGSRFIFRVDRGYVS